MTKLSVSIITFNEERKISRCLQSVSKVADEIIIVDSLSTDATRDICLRYDVIFIEQRFLGYIEQKNFALSKTSNPYVLCVDADEVLTEELIQSILEEKKKGFPADAYSMNRLNSYCGKWIRHGNWYPDRKTRLFDSRKGQWGGQNPHDKIIMQENADTRHLSGDLLHFTYEFPEERERQLERFSTIAAQSMFDKGKKSSYFKLLINPAWAFIKSYIIKRGFLDGKAGWIIARSTAMESFLKYKKLIRLHNESH